MWNIPPRNPNFVGREADLNAIKAGLSQYDSVIVETISGLGGIGKTQTAIEYAHRWSSDYEIAWWIDAEQPNVLKEQMASLAESLGLPSQPDLTARLAAVQTELRRRDKWLLIFDNAEASNDLRPFLPWGAGHVLITTRRTGFRDLGRVWQLDIPRHRDAIKLLKQRAPALTTSDADRISTHLGDLPLALAQAAAYLDETGIPVLTYLALLESHAGAMHLRGHADDYRHTVASVWKVSLDSLRIVNPAALELLRMCAWLAPEVVPLELFEGHPTLLPEPLATAASDRLKFNDAVGAIVSYSLARRTESGLIMHRMVQSVVRNTVDEADGQNYLARLTAILREHLPSQLDVLGWNPDARSLWLKYLSHLLALIDHAGRSAMLGREATAWLTFHAGLSLTGVDVDEAARLLRESHAEYEKLYGSTDPVVAAVLTQLGLHLADIENWTLARDVLERALRVQEHFSGLPDRRTAVILAHLGAAMRGLGDPGEARSMLERALAIQTADEGEDFQDPEVATTLAQLALALRDQGDPNSAKPLLQEAVAIRTAAYGRKHAWTATHMHHLGVVLADLGELEAARQTLTEALEIRQSTYGPRSGIVAMSTYELARVVNDSGEPMEAHALVAIALEIREQRHGSDHPDVIRCRNLLRLTEQRNA